MTSVTLSLVTKTIACVTGVQRRGRGEVECEREARWLGLVALRARIQLPPSLPFVRRPRKLPKQGKSPTRTEMSYFLVMTPSSSIPTNNLLEYTCHAYFYYRPLTSCADLYYILTCITFCVITLCVRKVITFCVEKLLHFALNTLLHFASMLLHFALVLHFAAILITFCVSITLCGDYYILRRNSIND